MAPKNKEAIKWTITYDNSEVCRAEAIQAAINLGIVLEECKDTIFTALIVDPSPLVKSLADKALLKEGLLSSTMVDGQLLKREAMQKPCPHLFEGRAQAETEIYLRKSLVGEQELDASKVPLCDN